MKPQTAQWIQPEEWETVETDLVIRGSKRDRKVRVIDKPTKRILGEFAIKPGESDADARLRVTKLLLEQARNPVLIQSDEVLDETLLAALSEENE